MKLNVYGTNFAADVKWVPLLQDLPLAGLLRLDTVELVVSENAYPCINVVLLPYARQHSNFSYIPTVLW
jgi:hypothetical protein